MPRSSDTLIVDTSGLILLNKIDELELLNEMGREIFITATIRDEFGMSLPEWISTTDPDNQSYEDILKIELDKGEASAIALSLEMKEAILVLDDLKGRR